MRSIPPALSAICLSALLPVAASAQTDAIPPDWSRGTSLNGFAGVAVDSERSGPVFGGAVGWQMTPQLAIEGSGSWSQFGDDTRAFAGTMKVRARLSGRRTIDPFLDVGIGMYRAAFGPGETAVPTFYRRRMESDPPVPGTSTTFTDPTVVGGGGVTVFLTRNLAVRPDVEATFVFRDQHSHFVTSVTLHVIYHFENHPVTPAVRR